MDGIAQAAGWLTPLLLLPGVGMLIGSTSVRYGQLHQELHHLMEHDAATGELEARHFLRRSRLFRNAFVSLYASVICLAASGLLGGAVPRGDHVDGRHQRRPPGASQPRPVASGTSCGGIPSRRRPPLSPSYR